MMRIMVPDNQKTPKFFLGQFKISKDFALGDRYILVQPKLL
jgi:hypothetical protein